MRGKVDKLAIKAFLATKEVALNFDKNVLPTKSVDQKLRSIIRIPGSALPALSDSRMGVSRAGDDVSPSRTLRSSFRRDAETSTRDARATRIIIRGEQRNEPFCKFR